MRKKFGLDRIVLILVIVILIAIYVVPLFGENFKELHKSYDKSVRKYEFDLEEKDGYYSSKYCKFSIEEWDDLYLADSGYEEVSQFLHFFDSYVEAISEILGTNYLDGKKITFTLDINSYGYIDRDNLVICYNKYYFLNDLQKASFVSELASIMTGNSKSDSLTEGLNFYIQQKTDKQLRKNYSEQDIVCHSKLSLTEENAEMLKYIGSTIPLNDTREDGNEYLYRQIYGMYVLSRSFTRYVIDEYGMDKFLELYYADDIENSYKKLYGKSLEEMKTLWINYVKQMYEEKYGN